jgi:hypothetical protein
MTVADQPGIAGEALYEQMSSTGSVLGPDGQPVAYDPQTASEMTGPWQDRAKALGIKDATKGHVHDYWEMLRWTALNYVAGNIHDMLNDQGLLVKNKRGNTMFVGGDSEQFQLADTSGVTVPIEASTMSRTAVNDALTTGRPSSTAEDCLALVPSIVTMLLFIDVPLEQWNQDVLRELCFNDLFPKIWEKKQFSQLRKYLSDYVDQKPFPDWTWLAGP